MNQIQEFLDYVLKAVKFIVIIQPWQKAIVVRNGKKVRELVGGVYFKFPYFDSVYVQDDRLRVSDIPMQTLTSKDGKTITLTGCLGYMVKDVKKLYDSVYHPELTLHNVTCGEIADYIYDKNMDEVLPRELEAHVLKKISSLDYGLGIKYFKLVNFAVVRTFRVMKEDSYSYEGLNMSKKQ